MDYDDAVAWLYGTQLHGIKLGLENAWRLARVLEIDVAGLRCIHVAGTNGKGSVCAMLEAIARAAGLKTGLFTSPHLITFRERIRVEGEMIRECDVAERLSAIRELVAGWDHSPTFFEITTALALWHFQQAGVDLVVLETGLGGRLDATNIVTPLASVLTPIDFDHQQYLGDTLAEIALEKAGIIKPGVPVVSARQREDAASVVRHLAFERGAPLHMVDHPIQGLRVSLAGSHQRWNAAVAVHALDRAGIEIPLDALVDGLVRVEWPGRFQQIHARLILDGAHNPGAARRLVETWHETFGEWPATIILGVLADKDARAIGAALAPIAARIITVSVQNPRSNRADELREVMRAVAPKVPCFAAKNLPQALRAAEVFSEPALVTGSLFLVGEALALLQSEPAREVSVQ